MPASRKLQSSDAEALLQAADRLIALKGKKVAEFSDAGPEAIQAMLGPTGNLRAPTIRVGKPLVVGFNEEIFDGLFA